MSLSQSQAREALVLSGRLVDDDGDAIPHVNVELVVYDSGGPTVNWAQEETDENGLFSLDLSGYLRVLPRSGTGDELRAAVSYELRFQPVNKVRGTQYCKAFAEAPLSITSE